MGLRRGTIRLHHGWDILFYKQGKETHDAFINGQRKLKLARTLHKRIRVHVFILVFPSFI
jgi:hypothetical protein